MSRGGRFTGFIIVEESQIKRIQRNEWTAESTKGKQLPPKYLEANCGSITIRGQSHFSGQDVLLLFFSGILLQKYSVMQD